MATTLEKKLTRLLVSIDVITGQLSLQAQWTDVITTGDSAPTAAIPQALVNTNYASLSEADQRAIAFPEFLNLADQFQSQPFTAVVGLLEALKDYQPQPTNADPFPPPQFSPFEGAP